MKTYHIITIGCQMNKSDSERIAAYLDDLGMAEEADRAKADIVIITTCGVRESAESRIYGLIPKIQKENPGVKIILTGCLSEREDIKKRMKGRVDIWLPIKELPELATRLQIGDYRPKVKDYLDIAPKYTDKVLGYIPIGNGCDNFCAYCVVPSARGREQYRGAESIINEAKHLIANNYKEINLIAQNVNSYIHPVILTRRFGGEESRDKQPPGDPSLRVRSAQDDKDIIKFPELLRSVNDLNGDFWLRFSSNHPKDMNDELIAAMTKCDKLCEHIHLPVQAGNDEVLKRMNRNYTVEHYLSLIEKIRQAIPGIAITTDVIVGFPGETEDQFQDTLKLFKTVKFDMAYTAQYSPRPGTAAYNMEDDVSREDKKRREEELTEALKVTALENNKKLVGQSIPVMILGQARDNNIIGRSRTNKTIKITNPRTCLDRGDIVKVQIKKARDFGLEGVLKKGANNKQD